MIEINIFKLYESVEIDARSLNQSIYGKDQYCAIDEQLYAQMMGWA